MTFTHIQPLLMVLNFHGCTHWPTHNGVCVCVRVCWTRTCCVCWRGAPGTLPGRCRDAAAGTLMGHCRDAAGILLPGCCWDTAGTLRDVAGVHLCNLCPPTMLSLNMSRTAARATILARAMLSCKAATADFNSAVNFALSEWMFFRSSSRGFSAGAMLGCKAATADVNSARNSWPGLA